MIRFLMIVGMIALAGLGIWQLGKAGLLAAKAFAAPILIEQAFAQSEADGKPVLPWPWSDSYPVAQMAFPKLGIKRFILSQSNMRNLAFGPTLQQVGPHEVLFAHRDTHFSFLKEVRLNDRFNLRYSGQEPITWRVAKLEVIDKNDFFIPHNIATKLLILVTCYPFDAVTENSDQRYVAWLSAE